MLVRYSFTSNRFANTPSRTIGSSLVPFRPVTHHIMKNIECGKNGRWYLRTLKIIKTVMPVAYVLKKSTGNLPGGVFGKRHNRVVGIGPANKHPGLVNAGMRIEVIAFRRQRNASFIVRNRDPTLRQKT